MGIGRDPEKLREASRLGAIDEGFVDWGEAIAGADVAVVCTPVSMIAADVIRSASLGDENLLVTDAGSTKTSIVARVESDARGRGVFVGGHPIAGSERQGVAHARGDLFQRSVSP